jgi:hypothetical protein
MMTRSAPLRAPSSSASPVYAVTCGGAARARGKGGKVWGGRASARRAGLAGEV